MPSLNDYLVLSAILFSIGTAGVFVRRNLITILLSIEIMLNAVNLTFVAFGRALGTRRRADHRVLRHDRRGRGSRGRPGHRHRALPAPRVAESRHVHGVEMVVTVRAPRGPRTSMLLLILVLPFVGFLLNAGVGRRLTKSASGAIAVAAMVGVVRAVVAGRRLVCSAAAGGARAIVQPVFTGSRPATSRPASRCASIRCPR